jgi:hypothetical protein
MQQPSKLLRYALLAVVAIGVWAGSTDARAQALYGTIYGQVTDPTGAAIPNAKITITDVSKGTSVEVLSNASGEYQAQHLIPDVYNVKAGATGFRSVENTNITVAADTSPKVDLQLAVGSADASSITVTSEDPQLKTDRADVAAVFDQRTVSDLPIAGRNFANLEMLIPGAQAMGWSQNSAEDAQGSPTIQIAGQHFSGVQYLLDGAANQDPILGQIVVNPPLDAVTEAKITTQDYDAEFGQAVAAVVSAQTKSGTNSFHGDAFDYRRSDAQQATNPYNQFGSVPAALYSQFGGSLGGPIRKNKIFAFGDYQGVRQRIGGSALGTVPTKLMHDSCLSGGGCDLSEFLSNTAKGPVNGQIYNPRSIDEAGRAAPFANNLIPNDLLSKQALALLDLLPTPNQPGSANGTANNFTGSGNGVVNQNQFDARVDDQVSEKIHAFGRFSYFANANSAATLFGKAGGTGFSNGFGGSANGRNQSAVAGIDDALNPKLLTDFRLGYLRYHVATHKFDGTDTLATSVGIPGLNLGDTFTAGSPGFYLNNDGLSNFGSGLNVNACNCPLVETEDQYQMTNNWTKIVGNHSIRFGADLRYGRNLRVPSDSNRAGELTFSANDTASSVSGGGIGLASFLLGDVASLSRYVSSSTNAKESQKRIFTYVQDGWRVTPNLTLNLGVRWELYMPETVNGKGNGGFADLKTGDIRVAGYGGINTAMNVSKDYKTIAPRIGVAYQINQKTVIRAGYGRSFDLGVFGSIFGHVVTQNLPVLANQSLNNSGDNSAAFSLSDGPTAFVFPAIPSSGLIPIPNGDNVKIRDDPNGFPTVDAWNLSLQRQVGKSSSFTLAYVANKGSHSFSGDGQTTNANEVAACLPGGVVGSGESLCWNPAGPSTPADGVTSNTQYLRPFYASRGWTQDLTYYHNGFDTHYNALQSTFEKRFTDGLQFTARYSWQRAFNTGGDYQEIDRKVNYGRYDDLREQQFQFYGTYDLPFGKGRRFLAGANGLVNYLVGGYEVSTSLNLASGLPFTASYGECGADIPAGPCRPNKGAGNLQFNLTSFDTVNHQRRYFTVPQGFVPGGPFTRPGLDQFGSSPRNAFTGPSYFNDDLTLLKNIPIKEGIKGQFRVDAFNAFNHIAAGNPGNTCIDCGPSAGLITGMAVGSSPRQLEFSATVSF